MPGPESRLHVMLALAPVALAAVVVTTVLTGADRPDRPRTLHVSARGSDEGRCTRRAPCRSFERAYRVARPGAVVEVAGGRYPGQTIPALPGRTSPRDVVFRPRKGARVEIRGGLTVRASHVEVRDLAAGYWKAQGGRDVTLRRLDVDFFLVQGTTGLRVLGGDVGPTANVDSQVKTWRGQPPRRLLLSGIRFHDARKTDPEAHVECLQIGAGVGVVIRGSRFVRCSDHDILVRSWGRTNGDAHPLRDFLIENNFFGATTQGYYSLRLARTEGWPCERFLVRNNSALQNMYSDCEARGVRFLANIQPSMSRHACRSGAARWDWNIYGRGSRCGRHDRVASVRFRAPAGLDLHVAASSAARGRAAPGSVPARDIDGQRRPQGAAADAGADERR